MFRCYWPLIFVLLINGCAYTSVNVQTIDVEGLLSQNVGEVSTKVFVETLDRKDIKPSEKLSMEIQKDAASVGSILKKHGIEKVRVTLSKSENRSAFCSQCVWIFYLIPDVRKHDIVVRWYKEHDDGSLEKFAEERGNVKTVKFFFLFPYSIYYGIKEQNSEYWDPEYGMSNITGVLEEEKGFIRLNRTIIKKVTDGQILP